MKINKIENFNISDSIDSKLYEKPILIKFEAPQIVKIKNLETFLKQFTNSYTQSAYGYESFQYGDYDNLVNALIDSITVDPQFSHYYAEDKGIYSAGETDFSIKTNFWYISNSDNVSRPFWLDRSAVGYRSQKARSIEDLYVELNGVFIIDNVDKSNIVCENEKAAADFYEKTRSWS